MAPGPAQPRSLRDLQEFCLERMGLRRCLAVENPQQVGPSEVVISVAKASTRECQKVGLGFCASAGVEKTSILPLDQLILRCSRLPPEQMVRVRSGGIGRHMAEFHPVRDLFGVNPVDGAFGALGVELAWAAIELVAVLDT